MAQNFDIVPYSLSHKNHNACNTMKSHQLHWQTSKFPRRPVPFAEDDSDHWQGHGEHEAVIVVGVLSDEVHAARGHATNRGLSTKFLRIGSSSTQFHYQYFYNFTWLKAFLASSISVSSDLTVSHPFADAMIIGLLGRASCKRVDYTLHCSVHFPLPREEEDLFT